MGFFGIDLFGSSPRDDLVPVKLNVPYVSQNGMQECGIASTMMILKYFGVKKPDRQRIKRMSEIREGDGSIVYGLARALASYELDITMTEPGKRASRRARKYLEECVKESGETTEERHALVKAMREEAVKAGVKIETRVPSLDEVLNHLSQGTVPLVGLNAYRLYYGSRDIGPHGVVVTGFDGENVIYHDPASFFEKGDSKATEKRFRKAMNDMHSIVIFASRRKTK